MKIYISPAGKTASKIEDFLARPRQEFGIDHAILFSSEENADGVRAKCPDATVITIANAYYGCKDYCNPIEEICRAALSFPGASFIINTSGGTEKMGSIVRAAGEILEDSVGIDRWVFAVYSQETKEVIFSTRMRQRDVAQQIMPKLFGFTDYQI